MPVVKIPASPVEPFRGVRIGMTWIGGGFEAPANSLLADDLGGGTSEVD
jgi:hypothetical protein